MRCLWVALGVGIVLLTGTMWSQDQSCDQTVGEAWNHIANNGDLGGDFGNLWYGYDWPGSSGNHNYYLWGSYFAVGATIDGNPYVTLTNYPTTNGEWYPDTLICGPGISDFDAIAIWNDYLTNPRNAVGRHLGLRVVVHSLTWASEPWNDIIFYVIGLTYDPEQCDIPGHGPDLDSLYLGLVFDCDVSGADSTENHIDDMVSFDGWVHGEWPDYPFDSLTLLPDSFLTVPDGYPDPYTVYGDDPWEQTLYGEIELVPRNTSYMWDDDDPGSPEDDAGEFGASAGYIGLRLIYAPPSSSDSLWVDAYGDSARIPRVRAHQWWTWESDPATDADFYHYLEGNHPATQGYRFAPIPYDLGEGPYDYRFLQTAGPYRLHAGDTLWFVFAGAVGQGLNGRYDDYYGRGWLRGLRQTLDYALAAYYAGSNFSDPYHPSGPFEDLHWVGIKENNSSPLPIPDVRLAVLQQGPRLTLEIHGISKGIVELYDLSGRKVKNFPFRHSNLLPIFLQIPVPSLTTGTYFVRVRSGNMEVVKKVILLKEK